MTLKSYATCGSDLQYPLTMLATKKIVRLKFYMLLYDSEWTLLVSNEAKTRPYNFSGQFVGLRKMDLIFRKVENIYYDFGVNNNFQFIFNFVSQIGSFRTLKLRGANFINVSKLLELRNIRSLHIATARLFRPPVEIRKIVRILRKIRESDARDLMHLIVNEQQSRELLVYEDIQNIATISIEDRLCFDNTKFMRFSV